MRRGALILLLGVVVASPTPALAAWTTTDPLDTARWGHGASPLPSGDILVAGGIAPGGVPTATSEVYSVGASSWTPGAALGTASANATLTLLSQNRVLQVGGIVPGVNPGDPPAATTGVVHYRSPNWCTNTPLPAPKSEHTATTLADGKLLVFGGLDDENDPISTGYRFDPSAGATSCDIFNAGSWALVDDTAGGARYQHTATRLGSLDNRVLITGGRAAAGLPLATTRLFDNTTSSYSAAPSLGTARAGHTATLLQDGRVLVVGGTDSSGNPTASAEILNPAALTPAWTPVASTATPRTRHTATLLGNGKVLVAGGVTTGGGPTATSELFDPATGTWTSAGSMATARYRHSANLVGSQTVLVAGGVTGTLPVPTESAELSDGEPVAVPPPPGGGATPPPATSPPAATTAGTGRKKCKKGFRLKKVRGKRKCVKKKKR